MKLRDLFESKITETIKAENMKAGDIVVTAYGGIRIIVESNYNKDLIAVNLEGKWQTDDVNSWFYHKVISIN